MGKAQAGSSGVLLLSVFLLILFAFPGTLSLSGFSQFLTNTLNSGLPGILLLLMIGYFLLIGLGAVQFTFVGGMTGNTLFVVGAIFFLLGAFVTDFGTTRLAYIGNTYLNTIIVMSLFFFVCIYVFFRDIAMVHLF